MRKIITALLTVMVLVAALPSEIYACTGERETVLLDATCGLYADSTEAKEDGMLMRWSLPIRVPYKAGRLTIKCAYGSDNFKRTVNVKDPKAWITCKSETAAIRIRQRDSRIDIEVLALDNKKTVSVSYITYGYLCPVMTTTADDEQFCGNGEITDVTLLPGATRIGDSAFEDCINLRTAAIPEGVTRIGEYAFFDCSRLEHLVIPASVTEIYINAFCLCPSLKTIVFEGEPPEIYDPAYTFDESVTILHRPSEKWDAWIAEHGSETGAKFITRKV